MNRDNNQSPKAVEIAESVIKQCAGARLRMLNRVVTRIYDTHLRSLGIRFSQLNILMMITSRGPMSPGDIGTALCLEKSTLSRNLKVLEDRGWISRQEGSAGSRVLHRSTVAGRRLVCKAEPHWRKAQDEVTELLGHSETAAIRSAFDGLQKTEIAI